MKCPNCGNHEFERLDYAIVCCTNCLSLWDPYVYPGWDDEDEENEDELEDWDEEEEEDEY